MIIQGTKVLLDRLSLKKEELVERAGYDTFPDSFFAWQGNIVTINRRKVLVFMNNFSKYTIVLYRPTAKDYQQIESLFKEAVREAFLFDGIKEELVTDYLAQLGTCYFSKTANRSLVGQLIKVCETMTFYDEYLDEAHKNQTLLSSKLGKSLMKFGDSYDYPMEQLLRAFCRLNGYEEGMLGQVLAIKAYQLKISLCLENFDIWRRITIPVTATFDDLHAAIQKVFGWFDYHVHEFRVLKDGVAVEPNFTWRRENLKLTIKNNQLTDMYEMLGEEDIPQVFESQTSLQDVFATTDTCFYVYDFGDNWEHQILLEKRLSNSQSMHPVLLERQGWRPPEDVGGEGGFEAYMGVINDPTSLEYAEMVRWAESTKEQEVSIEILNTRLKHRF